MAGDSVKARNELIGCGFAEAVLRMAEKKIVTLSMLRLLAWSMLNLLKDDPYIDEELVRALG